jgi:hypothetical protein
MAIAASSVFAAPRRWLPGNIARADTPDKPELINLVRLLFPHSRLTDEVYADVANSVFTSFASSSEAAQLLDDAESSLDEQQDDSWLDADEDAQLAALKNIQGEAFFAAILAALRGAFYNHPKVWIDIDYPGSSKEHGGYKYRGFNDISWLPEVE